MDVQSRVDRLSGRVAGLEQVPPRVSAVEESMNVLADTSLENRIDVEKVQQQLAGLEATQQQMQQQLAAMQATQQQMQQTLSGLQATQQEMQQTLTHIGETLTRLQERSRSRSRPRRGNPAIGAGTTLRR